MSDCASLGSEARRNSEGWHGRVQCRCGADLRTGPHPDHFTARRAAEKEWRDHRDTMLMQVGLFAAEDLT